MAIEEMVLCKVTFREDMLMDILQKLNSTKSFYPILSSNVVLNENDSLLDKDDTYKQLFERVSVLTDEMQIECGNTNELLLNFDEVIQRLNQIENDYKQIKNKQRQFFFQKENAEKTLKMISYLEKKDFEILKNCRFVMCQFGRLAREKANALTYSSKYPFLFHKVKEDKEFVWGYYVVNNRFFDQVEYLFHALKFEDIDISEKVIDNQSEMLQKLEEKIHSLDESIFKITQKMIEFQQTYRADIQEIWAYIKYVNSLEEKRKYVVKNSSQCFFYGFIAKRLLENDELLNNMEVHYQQLPVDLFKEQGVEVPVVIHNAKFVKPFERFSSVKKGDMTDITPLIAVMMSLILTLFLGDLGVGGTFLLIGSMLYKKEIGKLFMLIGLSVFIGGIVYGTVFYIYQQYIGIALSTIYRVCDGIIMLWLGLTLCDNLKKQKVSIHKKQRLIVVCVLGCYLLCLYETYINQLFMPIVFVVLFVVKKIMKKIK